MVVALLSLLLVPLVAWLIAASWVTRHRWTITGTSFGAIAYPFFIGLSIPMLYAGFPIGLIASAVMLLHMAPGRELVIAIVEHRRLTDLETMWVYGLNGVHWAVVYGLIGWFLDRDPRRKRTRIPLFLLAIPLVFNVIPSSKRTITEATWKRNNPAGVVCFQLKDADPDARVWFDIGSPKIRPTRFGSVPLGSKPYCGNYGLSLSPLTIQVYSATEDNKRKQRASDEDKASTPLEVSVAEGKKTCVGIFQGRSASSAKWSTRIIDCG
jgi:hypothetical protein